MISEMTRLLDEAGCPAMNQPAMGPLQFVLSRARAVTRTVFESAMAPVWDSPLGAPPEARGSVPSRVNQTVAPGGPATVNSSVPSNTPGGLPNDGLAVNCDATQARRLLAKSFTKSRCP